MDMLRLDHEGFVVDDLDAVAAFFLPLEFECDSSGKLKLVKYHAPIDNADAHPARSDLRRGDQRRRNQDHRGKRGRLGDPQRSFVNASPAFRGVT